MNTKAPGRESSMHTLENNGDERAGIVNNLIERRDRLIGTLLIGNNLVNILASSLTTSLLIGLFGDSGVAIATVAMVPKRSPLPKNWVPVTSRDMRNVLDPLSGLIIPAKARVCPNTLPIFDGESRLDIRLSPKGTRNFKTRGFEGEVIVCGIRFVPKAGYRKGREDVEYLRRLGTMIPIT